MKITITYGVSEEKYLLSDTTRIFCGIVAYAVSKTDGIASIVASTRNISSNKTRIEQLANLFNRVELSLIHLNDVIAVFLAE